jgi:hypothetical protein
MALGAGDKLDQSQRLPQELSGREETPATEVRIDNGHASDSPELHVPRRRLRKKSRDTQNPSASTGLTAGESRSSSEVQAGADIPEAPPKLITIHPIEPVVDLEKPEVWERQLRELAQCLLMRRRRLARRAKRLAAQRRQLAAELQAAQAALADRELSLAHRHRQLDERELRLALQEEELTRRNQELIARQIDLEAREKQLAAREVELRQLEQAHQENIRQYRAELEADYQRRLAEFETTQAQWERWREAQLAELRQARELLRQDHERQKAAILFEQQKLAAEKVQTIELHRLLRAQIEKYREAAELESERLRSQARSALAEVCRQRQQLQEQSAQLAEKARELERQAHDLEHLRRELHERIAAVENLRGLLQAERQQLQKEMQAEKLTLRQEAEEVLHHLGKLVQEVEAESRKLAERENALQKLQAHLERQHQELFHERLVLEELRRQILTATPPGSPTPWTSGEFHQLVRSILDQLQSSKPTLPTPEEVQPYLKRLETLQTHLDEEFRRLSTHRKHLEAWSTHRASELAQQAEALLAREEEIRKREATLADLATQWEIQKERYRQEILRLRLRLLQGQLTSPALSS